MVSKKYEKLVLLLVNARNQLNIRQSDIGKKLSIDQSTISRYESLDLIMDIELLSMWTKSLNQNLSEILFEAGYIEENKTYDPPIVNNTDAATIFDATSFNNGVRLILKSKNKEFSIILPNTSLEDYVEVAKYTTNEFSKLNKKTTKTNRDAIASALAFAIEKIPTENPSDIYHHIIYRTYLKEYNRTNPNQSWARAGGEALEVFFKNHYSKKLNHLGIFIELAFETGTKNKFLKEMGISEQVPGKSKLDICIYGKINDAFIPFAGIHSKASLAERVSDDKPCSEKMMQAGYKSYLFTMDAKSFLNRNLINTGELGSPESPSDKREYIEKYGSFDACFSYNTRTIPSRPPTTSGKLIYSSNFGETDKLPTILAEDWEIAKHKIPNLSQGK